jgi:hypothetical protein
MQPPGNKFTREERNGKLDASDRIARFCSHGPVGCLLAVSTARAKTAHRPGGLYLGNLAVVLQNRAAARSCRWSMLTKGQARVVVGSAAAQLFQNSNSYWSDQACVLFIGRTAWPARIYKQELINR